MRRFVTPLLVLLGAAAQAQSPQTVGTWTLLCATDRMTDRAACTLLHREPVERSQIGRPALALEIIERSGRMVPAVTARDLSIDGAARGLLALTGTAQLRLPPNRLFEMPCGLEGRSLICAPRDADLVRAAEELPRADRVLIRMIGLSSGSARDEPVELRLAETADAMARYRSAVPAGAAPAEDRPGLELRDILQRLGRLLG